VFSSERAVSEDDIFKCSKRLDVKAGIDCEQNVIIHVIPVRYILDGEKEAADPLGEIAGELKILYHIVTVEREAHESALRLLSECDLEPAGIVSGAYASALSVLNEKEKRAGALVLDMGKSRISAGIFFGGNFVHGFELPLGGDYVTGHIGKHAGVMAADAERLKLKYGAVLPEAVDFSEYIAAAGADGSEVSISKAGVLGIARPVLKLVFEVAKGYVSDNDFAAFVKRVVLTGGGANMAGAADAAGEVFGLPARIGLPGKIAGLDDKHAGPEYSVLAGLFLFNLTRAPDAWRYEEEARAGGENGLWGRIKKFIRDNF
jgi:cell division protein FtsA